MFISIASLQQPTFDSEFSEERRVGQSMTDYASQEMGRRVLFVSDRLEAAFRTAAQHLPNNECLFFTLPEFFWNVPWSSAASEDELLELSTAYLEQVPLCVEALMKGLPLEDFGHVVLLAGTCATLIKVGEGEDASYDVINYLLAASNFKFRDGGLPELSMWPKRYVSRIDFGEYVGSDADHWFFNLSENLQIKVKSVSSTLAEHNSEHGYGSKFSNRFIEQCPISINVCLDYAALEVGQRDEELDHLESKVDFLIACGMPFEEGRRYPDSVRYAVRNDGMADGECQFAEVQDGKITRLVPSIIVEDTLHFAILNLD